MAVQIQIRRGLAADWTSANPILAQGELGIELDTRKFKVGDGLTSWNSLLYVAARPEDLTSQISAAVSQILGNAPEVLDTLGELADAIGDNPNFVTTVTNLSDDFTDHETRTVSVHGIPDTAQLETLAGAQTKATAAETAAKSYTDAELAAATTSLQAYADTAETDAVTSANSYTDAEITTATTNLQAYADQAETDAVTAANTYTDSSVGTATTSLQAYADQAEADAVSAAALDATTKANAAQAAAEATASADATAKADAAQAAAIAAAAIDATTKANAAEAAANAYTDGQVSDLIQAAPGALDTLNELAAAINDDENFAATVATNLANAVTNLEAYADQAEADAITTAAADATTKANAAQAAAEATASADATAKANAAETAARAHADAEIALAVTNLQTYADTSESDAVTAANLYTDAEITTATTNLQAYADQAEADAISAAAADATSKANAAQAAAETTAAADATAKANAAETAANAYTDGEISAATTALQAYADTAEADAISAAATGATTKANAAQAAAISTAAADATTKANAAEAAAKTYSDSTFVPLTQRGAANGVPTLDGNAKIPSSQIPAVAIVDTFVVASEAAMLALTVEQGDVAVRSDLNKTFILSGSDPTLLSDWQELLSPTDAVASVDGRTGTVSLSDLYDASGSAAAAQTAAESYADSLAPNYDPAGSASAAQTAAQAYADSLAVNYDPAGSAAAAQTAAQAYADALDTDDVAEGPTNQYFTTQRALDATASAYDSAGSAAAAQSAAQAYADQAEADAITTAASDATTKADAAEAAAKTYADNNFVPDTEKGAANGVATLDANSKIPSSQIPAVALTDTFVVASETAMLALTAQTGDIAVRTDVNKTFVLSGTDASVVGDWQEMLTPTDAVQSVDGRSGTVSLSDLYDAAGSASSAQSAAESTAATALTNHNSATTNVHGIADTSLLETTAGAQAKADAAESAANAYTDSQTSLMSTQSTSYAPASVKSGYHDVSSIGSTAFTPTVADAGKLILGDQGSDMAVTLPPNSTEAFTVGSRIDFLLTTAQKLTFSAGAGATLSAKDGSTSLETQYSPATVIKTADNAWILVGDVVAPPASVTEQTAVTINTASPSNFLSQGNLWTINMQWAPVPDATGYELRVSDTAGNEAGGGAPVQTIIDVEDVASYQYLWTQPDSQDHALTFAVRGYNELGPGPWSPESTSYQIRAD